MKAGRIVEMFAIVMYLGLGVFLVVRPDFINPDGPEKYKIIFGILLVIYGVFRLYRLVKKIRTVSNED